MALQWALEESEESGKGYLDGGKIVAIIRIITN